MISSSKAKFWSSFKIIYSIMFLYLFVGSFFSGILVAGYLKADCCKIVFFDWICPMNSGQQAIRKALLRIVALHRVWSIWTLSWNRFSLKLTAFYLGYWNASFTKRESLSYFFCLIQIFSITLYCTSRSPLKAIWANSFLSSQLKVSSVY